MHPWIEPLVENEVLEYRALVQDLVSMVNMGTKLVHMWTFDT